MVGGQAALPWAVPAGIVEDGEDQWQRAEQVQGADMIQRQAEVERQRRADPEWRLQAAHQDGQGGGLGRLGGKNHEQGLQGSEGR